MGLNRYWQGLPQSETGRRDWKVNVARFPEMLEERAYPNDPSKMLDHLLSVRRWVESSTVPSFGAWAFDDEFAYLCVGANKRVSGVALFDREAFTRFYEIDIPDELLSPGAEGVAAWARDHAPMHTDAEVIAALARHGGAGDGVRQLMRVLDIDLPYDVTGEPLEPTDSPTLRRL